MGGRSHPQVGFHPDHLTHLWAAGRVSFLAILNGLSRASPDWRSTAGRAGLSGVGRTRVFCLVVESRLRYVETVLPPEWSEPRGRSVS
jgi:hypothetical protein